MSGEMELTLIEQEILLACMWQNPDAYGVSIRDKIKERTSKNHSFGTIYTVLERLENRGFLVSREGEVTLSKGGRKKQYFTVTGKGHLALTGSLAAMDSLRAGLNLGGMYA